MEVVVIGAGAAGFFAAIHAAQAGPQVRALLLERTAKPLAKVRISGGGRCNVTHHMPEPGRLVRQYPRGGRFLRKPLGRFGPRDTIAWFEARGVRLKAERDGRMFPVTDDSATIVQCLMEEARRTGVELRTGAGVRALHREGRRFRIMMEDGGVLLVDRVVVTTGGHPKSSGYAWLEALGHRIVPPVPSLFTFNMPQEPIRELMGVVVDPVRVRIIGTALESTGPLLITHWGMSGPAILRLSAWGARAVQAMDYGFTVQVNWVGGRGEEEVRRELEGKAPEPVRRLARNADPFGLPKRHWAFLLGKAGIDGERPWSTLAKRDRNRLVDLLVNDRYTVSGKTTFKEEFVTAGGVDLDEVDPLTMESRIVPGLFFAGEVLDIDGITGGFNFQAAWTTGHIAGTAAALPIRAPWS